ncbi:NAD(P)/FAD-dependent oxidoreductase [Parachitinimonas caeni]|uniref:NAD(P)/FAD-dependent oxidoreductase n=1 Tax=Parachitinimonas caeni TaxID=3031301 RepID=A0ABT7DS86_9NEIS|nr:NAD(P)/FAD-dependent oxidoreductase [Parachitinimonas caeni]MDK2122927.1 NAD(P)/FAD-dependent oxidoreductase [Parachitinimonas caeni]
MNNKHRIAVVGAGPMGLMCTMELQKRGYHVDIFEHDDRIGGMSATFDFDGLPLERYYHFVCKTDDPLFALLQEMGLSDKLKWVETKMGYYFDGKLYPWGTPQSLLSFPGLDMVSKLRYAAMVMKTKNVSDWRELDRVNVIDWLKGWIGERGYNVLWKSLFELKFHEYTDQISAAWLGTRIKRVGLSRKSLFKEQLGYLQGGSEVLLNKMEQAITAKGGRIFLRMPVQKVVTEAGQVRGVQAGGEFHPYDAVVSTVPIQYLPRLAPDLPSAFRERIDAIKNIAVACVVLKLKHAVTPNFWVNINDPSIAIPGVIEYSNLNPVGPHILYAPFYMPTTHPKYQRSNDELIDEVLGYLAKLNPNFRPDWVMARHCSRYEYAQTVCPPGFFDMLPPMKTPLHGLWMADTAYYYPEDRSICESVKLGRQLAEAVHAGH